MSGLGRPIRLNIRTRLNRLGPNSVGVLTRGSSSFWLRPRSVVVDDFSLSLAKKLSSNYLASWSKDEIKRGLRG
ncbi:hypothetical protein BHE74_00010461 [Ensete ventricosum]|nr:hypothetical protein GW17_00045526 [Ensete ventricosum]RWW81163.1 hypothetical protein BHE74_00010461 [Ensete ventricosum]RZR88660.1 hypothetical protein BHM03_00016299 [Ensete ventricosum]